MPPIVIPAGYSQVTLVHDVPGAHGEVCVVWGITDDGTPAQDLRELMDNWQDNVIEQTMCPSVTFREGRILRGPRPGAPALELGADPMKPTQGAQGPDMLPINNATLVSLITALGGVQFRGRKYLPGPPEGAVDNEGNLTVAGQAQFQTAMDNFLTQAIADQIDPVILHSPPLAFPRTDPPTYDVAPDPTPITSLQVQRKMATQRTRLRG